MTTAESKSQLGRRVRELRLQLGPDHRQRASQAACERLLTMPEVAAARTVALYSALGPEADASVALPLLLERDIAVMFPRVVGELLEFAPASSLDEFHAGFRGVLEPESVPIDASEIDVIVVPGVAFDRAGGRLGQGGGHYDRTLAQLGSKPFRVGFCFSCQIVDKVPREAHDELLDALVTEDDTAYIDGGS
ncbi:MAG TPA: 5-formyltetrahydrofolate cyclo-ligase [Actinomycetota bacterium]|nr:5-formyltetrahydrofolate cyclo-ligase [Actinomycetota bacterium]